MPTELPSAAWLAEQAVGWHQAWRAVSGNIMKHRGWFDHEGAFQAWVATWDPRTNDADALQLLDVLQRRWILSFGANRRYKMIIPDDRGFARYVEYGETRCEAICRAVEAYVLAQKGMTHADELPSAAWFAEQAVGWHSDDIADAQWYWFDKDNQPVAHPQWDPRTNDADALQLWEHVVPNPKQLDWSLNERVFAVWADRAIGGATMREAVCRAVEAYVLAREKNHAS